MLYDAYCDQYGATVAWLDRALDAAALHRREGLSSSGAEEASRSWLAQLSGAVLPDLPTASSGAGNGPAGVEPGVWSLHSQPAAVCLEPVGGAAAGLVLLWRPTVRSVVAAAGQYAAAGLRVVVPLLAGPQRSFVHESRRGAIAFNDEELLHLLAFLLGGSLAGLEVNSLAALAHQFNQEAGRLLPAALDLGGRAHLSAAVTAALCPQQGGRPLFALLVLAAEAHWLDHQALDSRANTIWSFHKHFDALTLLKLARPTHLLFVEEGATPSDLYCRMRVADTEETSQLRTVSRTGKATLAGAVAGILAGGQRQSNHSFVPVATPPPAVFLAGWEALYRDSIDQRLTELETRLEAADRGRVQRFDRSAISPDQYRERVAQSLARVTGPALPEAEDRRPRTRCVRVTPTHSVYFVLLESVPGIDVAGYLLLPCADAGRRPAVICQHGLGGRPDAVAGLNDELEGGWVYDRFAERLVQAGFVTFAPFMNWGWARTGQRDALAKRAFALGFTPNRFEVAQLHAIVDFLQNRPEVDPRRVAFYGLSYGGHASLWLTAEEPRLAAVVTAGHFNHWQRKLTSLEISPPLMRPTAYISVDEGLDMFNYNIGNELGHSELATRHAPRPYCVENGLLDTVTPTAWVEAEFTRVRAVYEWLGADRHAVLDHFPGPHRVWGQGSFAFLHTHLLSPDRIQMP